jgi:penicillin-binding protein 2
MPTVALGVIIENAGFGSDAAAPIARRVFDYLMLGQVPSAEDMALVQQGKATTPVGKPRPAEDYPLPGLTVAGPAPLDAQLAKETR